MRPEPRSTLRRALIVPAALAVSVIGPGCSPKDGMTDAASTGVQTQSSTVSGPTTGSGTTVGTGTTAGTGITGGELPDCSMYTDPEVCTMQIECLYLPGDEICIVRCQYFKDEASCEAQPSCYWEATSMGCYLAV